MQCTPRIHNDNLHTNKAHGDGDDHGCSGDGERAKLVVMMAVIVVAMVSE